MSNKFSFGRLLPLICLSLLLLSSCAVYHAQNSSIPLIAEKGELQVEGGASLTTVAAGGSVSYGVSNSLSAQIYGSTGADDISYAHVALGPYFRLKNDWILELQAGYGLGKGEYSRNSIPDKVEVDYSLMFTQVNLGRKLGANRKIEYGVGLKLGLMNADAEYLDNSAMMSLDPSSSLIESFDDQYALVEPQVFVRFGKRKLRLGLKLGYSWLYEFNERKYDFPKQGLNFGISLNYKIR
ncbi:hypothetical protein EMN47_05080 [Prolixibacteraceae bacterium JC049]|nr:hypothetical protein [Prolixibacteraceae bacterium JC049]